MRRLILVMVMTLGACAPQVRQPDIWLSSVRLVSLGIRGGVIDVELGVYNPNRFVIRADGLTYDLDFQLPDGDGWVDFVDGRYEERLRVAPGDTGRVVIPVEFSYRGLGGAVRSMIDRGSVDYRVSGLVAVEEPVTRDLQYRHAGTVSPSGVR